MAKSIDPKMLQAMDGIMSSGQQGIIYGPGMDGASATGAVFLVGELEKQDTRILEPLTSITGPKDITIKPGGGWVSNTSNVFVDYATSGGDEDGIVAGETNNIPVSQANLTKDTFIVNTFSEVLRVPLFDEFKLKQVGRSLSQILDNGLRLNFNKMLDRNIYVGISKTGTYGLVNNTAVTAASVATGASGSTTWALKTPDEILFDINSIITATWAASEYDLSGMATTILIPPSQYTYLVSQKVSTAGNMSILEYLLANNIAKNQGKDLKIEPRRWCINAGVGATNRMVAYVNEEDRVNMDLTVPLSRVMTAPNTQSGSYETLYAAQIGQVKILYTQPIRYGDGI